MTNSRRALWTGAIAVVAACSSAAWLGARPQSQSPLSGTTPPAGGVWVDSLDLSKIAIRQRGPWRRRPRRRGARRHPRHPPTYTLGGVTYAHTVPVSSDTDFTIDLKGAATRFESMVGIDDAVSAGRNGQPPASRGSVVFGVWVDGKKVADSGVMKGGDAPKLLSVDLTGAKRLMLAVNDGNDGTGSDNANWAGAVDHDGRRARRVSPERPRAGRRSRAADRVEPHRRRRMLNYPRITGATPGRPFMFLIPASATSR